jgi:hypothetical protein
MSDQPIKKSIGAIFKAFGRTKRGRPIDGTRVLNRLAFIDAKNLQSFIGADLEGVLNLVDIDIIENLKIY